MAEEKLSKMAIIKHYNNYWNKSCGHKSPRLAVLQSYYRPERIKKQM
jgi:hypothetical protein